MFGYFQQSTVFFLQMQEELLTEGFERKASELHIEILQLQKEIKRTKNDRLFEILKILTAFGLMLAFSLFKFFIRV